MLKMQTILDLANEVNELTGTVINISARDKMVLLDESFFKDTFQTYNAKVSEDGTCKILEAVFCGVTFHAVEYIPQKLTEEEKKLCEELNREEAQEREKAFWDIGIDPERNGGADE